MGSPGDVPGSSQPPHGSRRAVDPCSVPTQSHSSAAQPGCLMEGDSQVGSRGDCTWGSSGARVNVPGRSRDAQPKHLLLGVGLGRGRRQQTAPQGSTEPKAVPLSQPRFLGHTGKDSQQGPGASFPARTASLPVPTAKRAGRSPNSPERAGMEHAASPGWGLSENIRSVGRNAPSSPGHALGGTVLSQRPGLKAAPRT